MKKLSLLLLLVLSFTAVNAQKKEIKEKFKNYTDEKVYTIDGNEIVVSRVINDVPGTNEEVYIKVKDFFTRNYRSANAVLQTDDKEAGTIIGKGLFNNLFQTKSLGIATGVLKCYHILRVDIKDNRIRVICSADSWEDFDSKGIFNRSFLITDYAPFTDKRYWDKGKQMEAFLVLVDEMIDTIDGLEKTVKQGSLTIESEDW